MHEVSEAQIANSGGSFLCLPKGCVCQAELLIARLYAGYHPIFHPLSLGLCYWSLLETEAVLGVVGSCPAVAVPVFLKRLFSKEVVYLAVCAFKVEGVAVTGFYSLMVSAMQGGS